MTKPLHSRARAWSGLVALMTICEPRKDGLAKTFVESIALSSTKVARIGKALEVNGERLDRLVRPLLRSIFERGARRSASARHRARVGPAARDRLRARNGSRFGSHSAPHQSASSSFLVRSTSSSADSPGVRSTITSPMVSTLCARPQAVASAASRGPSPRPCRGIRLRAPG